VPSECCLGAFAVACIRAGHRRPALVHGRGGALVSHAGAGGWSRQHQRQAQHYGSGGCRGGWSVSCRPGPCGSCGGRTCSSCSSPCRAVMTLAMLQSIGAELGLSIPVTSAANGRGRSGRGAVDSAAGSTSHKRKPGKSRSGGRGQEPGLRPPGQPATWSQRTQTVL